MINSKGKIDIADLSNPPRSEEFETVKFLSSLGKNIKFIEPVRILGAHTPDIEMDKLKWEIKCPKGTSKRTLEHAFTAAMHQSPNLIFDLRSMPSPQARHLGRLKMLFQHSKSAKRMLIIIREKRDESYKMKLDTFPTKNHHVFL
ncbi:CdiA C-terminal domain-containing protein [Lactovum odontotermitis]